MAIIPEARLNVETKGKLVRVACHFFLSCINPTFRYILYKVLGLSRLVLQKVVWMWRAAGHFDVSACLTTHVMIAKLYLS